MNEDRRAGVVGSLVGRSGVANQSCRNRNLDRVRLVPRTDPILRRKKEK